MRIGYSSDGESANAHYRVLFPIAEMHRRGHTIVPAVAERFRETFAGRRAWDVMHIHRNMTPENVDSVRRLRDAGVAIVWDNDDATPRCLGPDFVWASGARSDVSTEYRSRWHALPM